MRENNFGKNILALRVCKGLTLSELSQQTHINAKTIQKYESGLLMPTVNNLVILSEHFRIDTDTLLKKEIVLTYQIKGELPTKRNIWGNTIDSGIDYSQLNPRD